MGGSGVSQENFGIEKGLDAISEHLRDNLAVLEGCAMRQEVAVSADAYIRPEKIFGRRKIGEAGAGSALLGSAPE